jgi:hypothetical protein
MGKALEAIMFMATDHVVMSVTANWSDYDWWQCDNDFEYEHDSPCIIEALGDIQFFAESFYPES